MHPAIKRYFALFSLGALMTLAMPPVGFFPVLFLCVPFFISRAQECKKPMQGFLSGWAFGAGYFIFGLYWISAALFVDIGQWFWVLPLSLIAGPALLGLFYGFIPLMSYRWRDKKTTYALAFIVSFSLVEYLRGHIFTGFPWNLPGQAWDHALPVMQIAAVTGVYGLTLLTIFWAATPFFKDNKTLLSLSVVSFVCVASFGMIRLGADTPTHGTQTPVVRIVQASIPQTAKWDPQETRRHFEKHLHLTARKDGKPSIIVWPETAVPADLATFPAVAQEIAQTMPSGAIGVLGSLRVTDDASGKRSFFNSVSVIDSKGILQATYDKHHLVPFGEYIPFREKLNLTPIANAISGVGDFTKGDGIKTLRIKNFPSFSPLICYEAIFPSAVANKGDRPAWLVNVTNDAWYGNSSGPYQHLSIVRLRSIEEGLPMLRAANSGISAIIDPMGRIVARTNFDEVTVLDAPLPQSLPPTPYARYGDLLFFGLLAFFMIPLMRRITH